MGVGMSEEESVCFVVVVVVSTLSWMMCERGVAGEGSETGSRLGRVWIEGRAFRAAILGHGASSNCGVEPVLPYLGGGGFRLGWRAVAMVGWR